MRVLLEAQRVLLGDHFAVHQGRAICAVCCAEVGLTITGVATAHSSGKASVAEMSEGPSHQPTTQAQGTIASAPKVGDVLDPLNLEDLRQRIDMLPPGAAARLDREGALRIVEELQRLQRRERELRSLFADPDGR
jgi:hypothetical protein